MGLGNLNPGCGCGCDIRVPVTDACRLAGQFWRPQGIRLTCQSFGGSAHTPCQIDPVSCNKPMKFNPSEVTVSIPRFDHPDFTCTYGASSYADYQTGVWSPSNPINECWGMWPIWMSGPCIIGFANFYRLGVSQNTWVYPYSVNGSVSFSYSPATGVGTLSARIIVGAFLFGGGGSLYGVGSCGTPPRLLPGPSGGTNWQFVGGGFSQIAEEINGPPIRTSRYVWSPAAAYGIPGAPGTFPSWCSDGNIHTYQSIVSESNYTIRTDDPVYGNKRSFELWTPSPAIDELGLTLGATISIKTAV